MGIDSRGFFTAPKGLVSDEMVRALACQIQRTTHSLFFIVPDPNRTYCKGGRIGITKIPKADSRERHTPKGHDGKVVYYQDGPPVVFDEDQDAFEIHFLGRYYGIGYERGDWPSIRAVIEIIRSHSITFDVWYGGDSSGCCVAHMNKPTIEFIDRHFYKFGHDAYNDAFEVGMSAYCVFCGSRMRNTMHGMGRDIATCPCCGLQQSRKGDEGEWGPIDDAAREVLGIDVLQEGVR